MTMPLKEKVARLKLVADGLRRIQEFESARYLDEYATHLTQPAQSVDVAKSFAGLRIVESADVLDGEVWVYDKSELVGKITAAL